MTAEQFAKQQFKKSEKSKFDYGLCPPPTTSDEGLDVLKKHFLGEDWYTTLPLSKEQENTEIIIAILEKTQPKNFLQRLFNI